MFLSVLAVSLFALGECHSQEAFSSSAHSVVDITTEPWTSKYGAQSDLGYTGPLSFSHFPYAKCLEDASKPFDIGIIGFPFDTTTSYRPGEWLLLCVMKLALNQAGARFGPFAIRSGSRRQHHKRGYTLPWGTSPYDHGSSLLDCGDVSIFIGGLSPSADIPQGPSFCVRQC